MGKRKEFASSSGRTPEPWHTRTGMSGVQIVNDAGICIARTPCFDRQAQADGALLAAAPELLQALIALVDSLTGYHAHSETADEARAAIAKAEARS